MITGRPVKAAHPKRCYRHRAVIRVMQVKTGVKKDGSLPGCLHHSGRRSHGSYASQVRSPGACRRYLRCAALHSRGCECSRTSRVWPSAVTAHPAALRTRVQLAKSRTISARSGGDSQTHLVKLIKHRQLSTIGSMGLGKCIESFEAHWKNKFSGEKRESQLPLAKALVSHAVPTSAGQACQFIGTACRNQACSCGWIARAASV